MHSKYKTLRVKFGFTLIELIVTLGILVIPLMIAYSMLSFGNNYFNEGFDRSSLQTYLRLCANKLTNEIRYCSNLSILDSMPNTPNPTMQYIYVDTDGIIKHYNAGNITNIYSNSRNITNTVQFQKKDNQSLYFNIKGIYKNQKFQIDSSVLLLNIGNKSISGLNSGCVICYTSGEPLVTNINAKPIHSIYLMEQLLH